MRILFIIAFVSICFSSFAQQEDKIDSLLNDLIFNDNTLSTENESVKYDFIYTGASYSNKTYYAGREVGSDLMNIGGFAFYFHSSGLFAGASGLCFDELNPEYCSTTLTFGYGHSLDKNNLFNFKSSYSRFIFNDADSSSIYPYENNLNLGLSFSKGWFGMRVQGNFLFGNDYTYNLIPAISSSFNFWEFGRNNKFNFGPEISCYLGTETITKKSKKTEDVFGLLNTQLNIPLSINLGNFELQVSYSLDVPFSQDNSVSYSPSSSYGISAAYMFSIEKTKKKK
jgi:hypothetical protein